MNRSPAWLLALAVLGASGCDYLKNEQDSDLETAIPDLVPARETPASLPSPLLATPASSGLRMLNVGDRFPMIRTVEQSLSQSTPQTGSNYSKIEKTTMTLSVEEIREGHTRFSVWFDRIYVLRDIAGERLEFDSERPAAATASIPPEFRAYLGLAKNGFSFWMDAENRIMDVVGFNEFVQKCLGQLSAAERQTTIKQLSEMSADDRVAQFLDDSLTLLPHQSLRSLNTSVESWKCNRRFLQPAPAQLTNLCTLKSIDDSNLIIEAVGDIVPMPYFEPLALKPQSVTVKVQGGRSAGRCTVDRARGLPVQSRFEKRLFMTVQVDGKPAFNQQKTIVSTLQMSGAGRSSGIGMAAGTSDRTAQSPQRPISGSAASANASQQLVQPADYRQPAPGLEQEPTKP